MTAILARSRDTVHQPVDSKLSSVNKTSEPVTVTTSPPIECHQQENLPVSQSPTTTTTQPQNANLNHNNRDIPSPPSVVTEVGDKTAKAPYSFRYHSIGALGSFDVNMGMNTNRSNRAMIRRMSSDYSTQSLPSPSFNNRRVIFPSLYPRHSWPVAPCTEKENEQRQQQQQNNLDCSLSKGDLRGPGCTVSVPVPSVMEPVDGQQPTSPEETKENDVSSRSSASVPERGESQHQPLVLPSPSLKRAQSDQDSQATDSSAGTLPSILRNAPASSDSSSSAVDKIPSVESDIPSLASASTMSLSSVDDTVVSKASRRSLQDRPPLRRSPTSFSSSGNKEKKISFSKRVVVREFKRAPSELFTTWYSRKELENFKEEAMMLIRASSETELVPTGTGRFISRKVSTCPQQSPPRSQAIFSHRALRLDGTDDDMEQHDRIIAKQKVLLKEIRRVLIVDPHDICLKLFAKGFKNIYPHVEVVGTLSAEEALKRSTKESFDIILVEERLKLFHHQQNMNLFNWNSRSSASGATLIQALKQKQSKALFIGVSTRLTDDAPKLKAGGADFCWSKPPPRLDASMADELLRAVLERRKQFDTVKEIFVHT